MRRIMLVLMVVSMFVVMLASAAFAHDGGPCNDSGGPGHSDYARHHIVVATPGHVPGTHNQDPATPCQNRPQTRRPDYFAISPAEGRASPTARSQRILTT